MAARTYHAKHEALIEAIVALLPKSQRSRQEFVRAFFAAATTDDLSVLTPQRATAIAIAAQEFMLRRDKKGPKITISQVKIDHEGQALPRTQIMVLNDDRPFLVDSLTGLLTSRGLSIHTIFHPVLATRRDKKGVLESANVKSAATHESLIYLELSPLPETLDAKTLSAAMTEVLNEVAHCVEDWDAMRERTLLLAEQFTGRLAGVSPETLRETRELLVWLADNHFVFLGMGEYKPRKGAFRLDGKSALGLYRTQEPAADAVEFSAQPLARQTVRILKSSQISRIHRPVLMDLIVVTRFDGKGNVIGEIRILGLFTSTVYYRETRNIPFLRSKTEAVLRRAGYNPQGHSGKTLKTVLEFYPRDELFQISDELLFQTIMGILTLEHQPKVKLFVRNDDFGRFVSAMVYVPREGFSTELRHAIVAELERTYAGKSFAFFTQISESPVARLHVLLATESPPLTTIDLPALEGRIAALANRWEDALRDAVTAHFGAREGPAIYASFARAFPADYINITDARDAAYDIRHAREAIQQQGLAVSLFQRPGMAANMLHLHYFTTDTHVELSRIIPSLDYMGAVVVDVAPTRITPKSPLPPVLLRRFLLRLEAASTLDFTAHKARLEEALLAIWRGTVDNDAFNALIFATALTIREIEVLRAYGRYLQQLDFPYSQPFIAAALAAHPRLCEALVALFTARFDPEAKERSEQQERLRAQIEQGLENDVSNLAHDRIIRQYLALILATLRTNFYQREQGQPKPVLSLKLRSAEVPEMKLPIPHVEVFVTSRRVEGIHLRGGRVARGGLRWSDRPEDFRTEILGLMKTQMVKNAVIVPQGAKGGFILRQPPAEREAFQAEGIACYTLFLRGILDLTDNIVHNQIVPPSEMVRYDEDDPYLVVAADKGTASFSDIANAVAAEYGFWLGDAFASGGSVGYDHKAIAITARGGWVSVERHFREMGRDIGATPFTAVGIGDMSGDVFGNGALLSRHMLLLAAFNHRHIFLDPTPDAETSFAERQRLFALPRSGWNDYNAARISKGGGVYERSAKSITLSAEARKALGAEQSKVTPDELIRIILRAPVDLLWNGGIGTYVKASSETHEQVGDRANNAVRVNGAELRAKIVGEGGNLGFTQRGRIEYALAGGRINTDAIDNSGGVDCSDHEVNIKIALGHALENARLSVKARDQLLKKMTEEVARLVLRDNELQTQAISIAQLHGAGLLEPAEQLMTQLEQEGILIREVEALPSPKVLAERRNARLGLTRPEISVLLAYAKMAFFRDLRDARVLSDPYFEADLLRYFPTIMQEKHAEDIRAHRLRREIVATMITNSIVNRTGFSFAQGLMQATGLTAADIAQSYVATRDAFSLRGLWSEIEALDGLVPAETQSRIFVTLNRFIEHSCRWFLANIPQPMDLSKVVSRYRAGVEEFQTLAPEVIGDSIRSTIDSATAELLAAGVPEALAGRLARLDLLYAAGDVIEVAAASRLSQRDAASLYFALGLELKLGWLRQSAQNLPAENYWQQLAVKSLVLRFYDAQRRLAQAIALEHKGQAEYRLAAWLEKRAHETSRYAHFLSELRRQPSLDYSMLIVALHQLQELVQLERA